MMGDLKLSYGDVLLRKWRLRVWKWHAADTVYSINKSRDSCTLSDAMVRLLVVEERIRESLRRDGARITSWASLSEALCTKLVRFLNS